MVTAKSQTKKKRKRRVKEPLTDELLQKLLDSPDPAVFAAENRITKRDLPAYLQQLLDEKGLQRPKVIQAASLNQTYGWEIFNGRTHASREHFLALIFAMKCTLTEANRILQAAGHNELYCKNRRDAIIIFCLDNDYTLQQTNEALYKYGETTINEKTVK